MTVTATVPATVANLGPGFDCLALAVDLTNEFTIQPSEEWAVDVAGEGKGELTEDATNVVFRSISYLAREAGGTLPPFRLRCVNRIPLARGLGSSTAAVVGGLLLGDRVLGTDLSADALLEMAADIEGHADNAAACLRGRISLAYLSSAGWRAETLEPSPSLRPVLLIPEAERMSTQDARRVIPRDTPLGDAAFNASRSALTVLALTERPGLLREALEDRLHQPYRLPLMPGSRALFEDLREAGFPVCVAGSGPSLLVFEDGTRSVWELGPGWRTLRPAIAGQGATVQGT